MPRERERRAAAPEGEGTPAVLGAFLAHSRQGKDTQDMRSGEAKIGASVRVSDSGLHPELRGQTGTVSGMWGHPEYLALDVRMEDGRTRLFWHHELEEIAKRA